MRSTMLQSSFGLLLGLALGCGGNSGSPTAPGTNPPAASRDAAAAAVVRAKEKLQAKLDLNELGKMFEEYRINARVVSQDGFKKHIALDRNAAKLVKALDEGRYVLCFSPQVDSNKVLAAEGKPDYRNNRVVVMVGSSVQDMTESEYQAAVKR